MLICILLWSLIILSCFQLCPVRINLQLHNTRHVTQNKEDPQRYREKYRHTDRSTIYLSILIYLYKSIFFKKPEITPSYLISRFIDNYMEVDRDDRDDRDDLTSLEINILLPNLIMT